MAPRLNEFDPNWQNAWAEELDRRDTDLDSGEMEPLSLDDVRRIMHDARDGKHTSRREH